jgi:hypothetical protein
MDREPKGGKEHRQLDDGLSAWWDDSASSNDELELISKKIMECEALWRTSDQHSKGNHRLRPSIGQEETA